MTDKDCNANAESSENHDAIAPTAVVTKCQDCGEDIYCTSDVVMMNCGCKNASLTTEQQTEIKKEILNGVAVKDTIIEDSVSDFKSLYVKMGLRCLKLTVTSRRLD